VLDSGIDVRRFRPAERARTGGRIVLGCVSRLDSIKAHDVLIDALWHRAARAVNWIAAALAAATPFREAELAEYASAFQAALWNAAAGTWYDVNLALSLTQPCCLT